MKRLQIMIDEDLDAALDAQAARERVSKAELVRRYVAAQLTPPPAIQTDPLWTLVGLSDGATDDSRSVDEVVYRSTSA
jgi:Ribbon-helix-helix protein, copG family